MPAGVEGNFQLVELQGKEVALWLCFGNWGLVRFFLPFSSAGAYGSAG